MCSETLHTALVTIGDGLWASGDATPKHISKEWIFYSMTIPASPSAALVIGLAMDMLATDGSTGAFEASSPVPVRRLPTAAPASLAGSEGAEGELTALESGGRDGDRGVSDAGVTLEYVVAGVGCEGIGTGSVEGAVGASVASVGVSVAVVGVVVDADVVDAPIAAAAAYRNGGSVGGRDDPILTALAIDVAEKFGAGIGGFGAAGAVECRKSVTRSWSGVCLPSKGFAIDRARADMGLDHKVTVNK